MVVFYRIMMVVILIIEIASTTFLELCHEETTFIFLLLLSLGFLNWFVMKSSLILLDRLSRYEFLLFSSRDG
jgi:hypothetical protein